MKDKILEILKKTVRLDTYEYWAHEELHIGRKISELSLADATTEIVNLITSNNCVSGNEANPEIKQSGEVAVCECEEPDLAPDLHNRNFCMKCGKYPKQTDR